MTHRELTVHSAALLTPVGRGAVATIRLQSDPERPFPEIPFRAANGRHLSLQPVGRIVFGLWGREADHENEEVVVCRISGQTWEIHCHGGNAAVQRILDDLQQAGCQILDWSRQVANMSGPFEAECKDALSRATTWKTAEILHEQSNGLLRRSLEDMLRTTGSDDSELSSRLNELLDWASFGIHLTQPWRVILTGRPNVGKSSLINALLGYERAIVFDQPGTTRDLVTAETAFEGWPVQLTDTAGLRVTSEALEAAGIALTRQTLQIAEIRVILVDLSADPTFEDEALLAEWPDAIVVGHKSDLVDRWQERLPRAAIRVSSVSGAGLKALQQELVARMIPRTPAPGTPIPVTERQVRELSIAREALLSGDAGGCRQAIERILGD